MSNNKILILRFRDLVTENDETIAKHKEIIDKHEYVWWAWWKKGHEKTPTTTLAMLKAFAQEYGIDVYLVDSALKKLYKASCSDIIFSIDTPKTSPDLNKTPEYYNSQSYYAWFKFDKIEECPSADIKDYTYVNLKELFEDGTADYSLFCNKRIYSLDELIQQNRTMWIARKFQNGDKENEITLLNANIIQPCSFSNHYYEVNGNSLLWISDLHFGNSEFPIKSELSRKTLAWHIKDATKDLYDDISGLILSGDISNCANENGYDIARRFIQDLQMETKQELNSANIMIAPGNHDFKRIEENYSTPDNVPNYIQPCTDTSQLFSDFYKDIYYITPNEFFASGKKILLKSGITIDIAVINSCRIQQYKDFEGHGYISHEQMEYIEREMKWNNEDNSAIRIVVMHHHYLPTCREELINIRKASSVVYDANNLMNWLVKNNIKLLLHGHKHSSFMSKISYPKDDTATEINCSNLHDIYVVGLGGTGISGVENEFAIVTVKKDKIFIKIYKIYSDQRKNDSLSQTIIIPLK